MASQFLNLPLLGSGASGVTSLNGLVGALTLVAGSGITITPSGTNITIASTVSPAVQPLYQVVVGTGTGITSSAHLESNPGTSLGSCFADSVTASVLSPATVTIVPHASDPSTLGNCTNTASDANNPSQYDNDSVNCPLNGYCVGVPGDLSDPPCTLDGGVWTPNVYTPISGYQYGSNGSTATYNLYSHISPPGLTPFYSTSPTSQTFTYGFDTDSGSVTEVQNGAESGYTASGVTFSWTIFSVDSFGLRTVGTFAGATDNNDGLPYAWDLAWAVPVTSTATQYLVVQTSGGNPGTAMYTATTSITDDGSWSAFVDPGLGSVVFDVSWSSVANVDYYILTSNLQGGFQQINAPTVTYNDFGNTYIGPGGVNPKGPFAYPAYNGDGINILKNDKSVEPTLQVWAPTGGTYSQQWFDSSGTLKAYIDNSGTFTGGFSPISGQFTTFQITASGHLISGGDLVITTNSSLNAINTNPQSLVPTTGQSITRANFALVTWLNPAGTLATLSYTLANGNQNNGQLVILSSTQTITALTITDTFIGTKPTTLLAGHAYLFMFVQSGPAWTMLGQM